MKLRRAFEYQSTQAYGSVLAAILLLCISGFIFGWAKFVLVNNKKLKAVKRKVLIILAAGPAANLVMSLFWAIAMKSGYLKAQLGLMIDT